MAWSYRGKFVDMVSLAKKHENSVALGNAHMNGRGDILEHGQVVKSREEQLADWYASHTTTKSTQNLKEVEDNNIENIENIEDIDSKKVKIEYKDITEEEIEELKKVKL